MQANHIRQVMIKSWGHVLEFIKFNNMEKLAFAFNFKEINVGEEYQDTN